MGHTCTSRCWVRLRCRRLWIKFRQGTTFSSGIQSPLACCTGILFLIFTASGPSLAQSPPPLDTTHTDVLFQKTDWLRGDVLSLPNVGLTEGAFPLAKYDVQIQAFELELTFRPETAFEFGVLIGDSIEVATRMGYNMNDRTLFIEQSRQTRTHAQQRTAVAYEFENNLLRLRLFSDGGFLQVANEHGYVLLSTQIETSLQPRLLELYALGGNTNVVTFTLWPLRPKDAP